jgi:UDP-glucose 4-epimerase
MQQMATEILLFDDFSTQKYNSWYSLPKSVKYVLIEGDLRKNFTPEAIEKCDAVIHLAANTRSASSFTDPSIVQKNIELTRHVAECCRMCQTPMVFASTTSVYGEHSGSVNEAVAIQDPKSPYALMKLTEERLLADYARHGLVVSILRFGTIFGFSPGMQFHTAVNKFCWQAATRSMVTVWSTALDQSRPYLHVSDAAEALCHAVGLGSRGPKTVNIVGANATVREILSIIQRYADQVQVAVEDHPGMGETSYVITSDLAVKSGYLALRTLDSGVCETMKHLSGGVC